MHSIVRLVIPVLAPSPLRCRPSPPSRTGARSPRRSANPAPCSQAASTAWASRAPTWKYRSMAWPQDRLRIRRLGRLPADGYAGHGHGRSRADTGRGGPGHAQLEDGGIEISALHNHLLRAEPATLYMHIRAMAIRSSLRAPPCRPGPQQDAVSPPPGTATPGNIDMIGIDRIMGYFGQVSGGIY